MREIASSGARYAEASADTELDPLYLGPDYINRWVDHALESRMKWGVQISNLYSGHGTYATLGLAHTDTHVRTRFIENWLKPMVATANRIDAGLGFFCHAFPQSVIADPIRYQDEFHSLVGNLARIAEYNMKLGNGKYIGVEQMYTPHQVPWTIDQSKRLIREVYSQARAPFYITIDVGHQSGQHRFLRPNEEELKELVESTARTGQLPTRWIGPDPVMRKLSDAASSSLKDSTAKIEQLSQEMDRYPHLFADKRDGDPYAWLRELAGWSPIIHLQQTDGTSSSHLPFDQQSNRKGIVEGKRLLQAIKDHYDSNSSHIEFPDQVSEIYLTIEVFSGTADTPETIRKKIRDSVAYWRQTIPEDGKTVDTLLDTN